ncbi:MAG: lysozyme inhibitor LprI family protein [Sphingomonas sp.]
MIVAALALAAANVVDPCDSDTTIQINACLAAKRDAADAELKRYLAAARERLAQNDDPAVRAEQLTTGFDASQIAWAAYRQAACDTVYRYWQGGTIRAAQALQCQIDLTHARTRFVWQTFLTYPDSAPPILPEPKD